MAASSGTRKPRCPHTVTFVDRDLTVRCMYPLGHEPADSHYACVREIKQSCFPGHWKQKPPG